MMEAIAFTTTFSEMLFRVTAVFCVFFLLLRLVPKPTVGKDKLAALREKNVRDVSSVRHAFLEVDGDISVLSKKGVKTDDSSKFFINTSSTLAILSFPKSSRYIASN